MQLCYLFFVFFVVVVVFICFFFVYFMVEKYPEIKKLMGPDPEFKYIVSAMVIFQMISCYWISQLSMWWILFFSYFLGGVINHSLTLAIHDISHNVVFGNYYPVANRLFSIWANLPIGLPIAIAFKKYHVEHHRFLGQEGLDVDLATRWEGVFFRNTLLKIVWLFLQPLFYAFRPVVIRPKKPSWLEVLNFITQLSFDVAVLHFCGYKGLVYLIGGTIITMGLHPMAGHFISEHYMFDRGYETYSYYGILNKITFNVGYHMEHHDFPYIPGSRLPQVKKIASEFYDPLPQHSSWVKVIWEFLANPNIGPYARVCRDPKFFNESKNKNPFFDVATPAADPTNKDLRWVGLKEDKGIR